jgi:hypothetical protein
MNEVFVWPVATRSLSRSTIIVCGVIGYADVKSTFDCTTAFATASEPLIATKWAFCVFNKDYYSSTIFIA